MGCHEGNTGVQASGILARFYFIINLGSWRGGDDAGVCFGIT